MTDMVEIYSQLAPNQYWCQCASVYVKHSSLRILGILIKCQDDGTEKVLNTKLRWVEARKTRHTVATDMRTVCYALKLYKHAAVWTNILRSLKWSQY